jgi:hypothetical protein
MADPACTCCTCPARRCRSAPTPTRRASSTPSRRAGSTARPARTGCATVCTWASPRWICRSAARHAPPRGRRGAGRLERPAACLSRNLRAAARGPADRRGPLAPAASRGPAARGSPRRPATPLAFAVACATWHIDQKTPAAATASAGWRTRSPRRPSSYPWAERGPAPALSSSSRRCRGLRAAPAVDDDEAIGLSLPGWPSPPAATSTSTRACSAHERHPHRFPRGAGALSLPTLYPCRRGQLHE